MDNALGEAMAARGSIGLAPAIERVIAGRPNPVGNGR
jgi:hypothetical protein